GPIPINTRPRAAGPYATYYDPAGADFKQGVYGTAPPGPAIFVTPGENLPDGTPRVFGLPSGSSSMICFDGDRVKDTSGNALAGSNCVTLTTKPMSIDSVPGDYSGMPDRVLLADLVQGGITLVFNAPIAKSDLADANGAASWLKITYQTNNGAL